MLHGFSSSKKEKFTYILLDDKIAESATFFCAFSKFSQIRQVPARRTAPGSPDTGPKRFRQRPENGPPARLLTTTMSLRDPEGRGNPLVDGC